MSEGLGGELRLCQAARVATKSDLESWIAEALRELGGQGSVVDVCRVVWQRHEDDLRSSGDLFFTWQYDIRWAAQKLRDRAELAAVDGPKRRGPWRLA
jgi:hypothetical protein